MNTIEEFSKKGYCIVRSAISNELRDFVTQTLLFDEGQKFIPGVISPMVSTVKYLFFYFLVD